MKKSTKGFYTIEAVIFLPLVILAILSLGYFIKTAGVWENCIHGAVDESVRAASRAYGKSHIPIGGIIEERMLSENPRLEYGRAYYMGNDGDEGTAIYKVEAGIRLVLPLGFEREFSFETEIKYRGFIGKRPERKPMGAEGLEQYEGENPVWVFPQSGERYHGEGCTYVKASVTMKILNGAVRGKYRSCGLCHSEEISTGGIVFCFSGEDTAYHRGICRSIKRHTSVIDKSEAEKKGYTPCRKCGGA